MEALKRFFRQLGQTWNGMSMGRRFGLLLLVFISLAAIIGVGFWAAQPDYRVLYADLAPEDAGAITTKLSALNVPYRLGSGGTSILVPSSQVQQLRLDLAMEGLPVRGGKGFELFDGNSLGATPFTQHVNYLRALQGELAKTITQIESVAYARVHIVRPEASPFIRDQKPPTASVVLRLKPGATLHRSVAAGIAALVARSVEGLTPEQVTILDTTGRVLSESQSLESGAVASQLDYRRTLERHLASKAEEMLERVLGPGRAIVRVTADVNFQRLKEKRETYNPEGRVITSEKITSVKNNTSGSGRGGAGGGAGGGAAGASSNLPGARSSSGGGSSTNNQEETTETGYAVSKTIQEVEDKMGNLERLTIAAMVDLTAGAGGEGQPKLSLTVADVTELVKQAVGYKTDRDEIKVSDVRLTTPDDEPFAEQQQQLIEKKENWQQILQLVRNASLGVAGLVAVVLVWMTMRPVRPAQSAPVEQPAPAVERNERMERLFTTARREPEAIARVFNHWLDRENGKVSKAAA